MRARRPRHQLSGGTGLRTIAFPARVVVVHAGCPYALGRGHVWHSISQTVKAAALFIEGKPLPEVDDAVAWDLESGPHDSGSTG